MFEWTWNLTESPREEKKRRGVGRRGEGKGRKGRERKGREEKRKTGKGASWWRSQCEQIYRDGNRTECSESSWMLYTSRACFSSFSATELPGVLHWKAPQSFTFRGSDLACLAQKPRFTSLSGNSVTLMQVAHEPMVWETLCLWRESSRDKMGEDVVK